MIIARIDDFWWVEGREEREFGRRNLSSNFCYIHSISGGFDVDILSIFFLHYNILLDSIHYEKIFTYLILTKQLTPKSYCYKLR